MYLLQIHTYTDIDTIDVMWIYFEYAQYFGNISKGDAWLLPIFLSVTSQFSPCLHDTSNRLTRDTLLLTKTCLV